MPGDADIRFDIDDHQGAAIEPVETGAEIVRFFAEAGVEVALREVGGEATWQPLSDRPATANLEVKALVGLTGGLRGSITFALSRDSACDLFGAMSGQPPERFNELALSAIGELANVISGRATLQLEAMGKVTEITPPILVVGKGAEIMTVAARHEYARLETAHGPILIDLGIDD